MLHSAIMPAGGAEGMLLLLRMYISHLASSSPVLISCASRPEIDLSSLVLNTAPMRPVCRQATS